MCLATPSQLKESAMSDIVKKWLNLTEASTHSGESKSTLLRRIKQGVLKGKQRSPKGRWLVHIEDLIRYCDKDFNAEYGTYIKEQRDEN